MQRLVRTQAHLCGYVIGNTCGPLITWVAMRRGTLQAVFNVMGSLYLSVLFLGAASIFHFCPSLSFTSSDLHKH